MNTERVRQYLRNVIAAHPALHDRDPDPESVFAEATAQLWNEMNAAEKRYVAHVSAEMYFGQPDYLGSTMSTSEKKLLPGTTYLVEKGYWLMDPGTVLTPAPGRILIRVDAKLAKTRGGVHMPDTVKTARLGRATVLAHGAWDPTAYPPPPIGQRVVWDTGTAMPAGEDGQHELCVILAKDVVTYIEEPNAPSDAEPDAEPVPTWPSEGGHDASRPPMWQWTPEDHAAYARALAAMTLDELAVAYARERSEAHAYDQARRKGEA